MKIICDKCSFEFLMDSVEIKEEPILIDGKKLILSYFTCPECKKIYRIALKDKRYEELKCDLEKIKSRIRKNYGNKNEELARMLNKMAMKKHNRLRNHVAVLEKKYPGTFTFVASENNHEGEVIKYLP